MLSQQAELFLGQVNNGVHLLQDSLRLLLSGVESLKLQLGKAFQGSSSPSAKTHRVFFNALLDSWDYRVAFSAEFDRIAELDVFSFTDNFIALVDLTLDVG